MEPLTIPNPERFSRALGLSFKASNSNGKIWVFVEEGADFEVEDDSDQVLHGRFTSPRLRCPTMISVVYAKCTRGERSILWDKMREIPLATDSLPWIIGGDFNTILTTRDRVGSETNRHAEMIDFAEAIEDCRLIDPGFDGSDYTWAKNGLLERLDRVLVNEPWTRLFEAIRVTKLPRFASDHGPVLVRCKMKTTPEGGKAFRFQNIWTRHEEFRNLVHEDWEAPTEAEGLINLQIKLSRIKKTLKRWNKEIFGNIHANLRASEESIATAQADFEANPSPRSRTDFNREVVQYILLLKMEEDFWKQKASLKWLEE
ncbi:uncharacterized protein LOC121766903 [Salvia splendens]|uniref:uncharacterized protein LOC121766903 n=1 Tax=Salvia splendens TaxID=180675 RepID=UPI001C26B070|nr:uncharacterized protein LOC121766903 [Salvia splendens]